MKMALISVVLFCTAFSVFAQKPTKTETDLKKASESIKAIGNLFKKKPKPGETGKTTTSNGNPVDVGTDGTMPSPGDKIFGLPGGGVLFAGLKNANVLINRVIYGWGDNYNAQAGNGKGGVNYLPTQITTDNDWKQIFNAGAYNLAIKNDGTLWSWGWGNTGELGLGNVYNIDHPTRVGHDTTWASVSGSDGNVVALKTDGSLWVWGSNVDGELGVGPTLNSKSVIPMLLNKDRDWVKAVAGEGYTLALKKDGSLWAWGGNFNGNLGTQTLHTTQQAPIRIGTDHDWAKIFAGFRGRGSFAIKTDGTLWAWGYNRDNQLGIGESAKNSFTPQQVGVDKDWVTISNAVINTIGIKADGSMWQWGNQIKGIQRVNVRGKWIAVAAGMNFAIAMRSDGTLWARGDNSTGQLGYVNDKYFGSADFVQIKEFPKPVITTRSKAALAGVLSDEAALLFKQSNSRLSVLDKNKVATVLNFGLSKDKKQFILDAQSADYPFDVHTYATDMNKDGIEEIFVQYGNSYTSGRTGSAIYIFFKDAYGDWHIALNTEGLLPAALTTGNLGYADLAVGIPGFQYPVFRWNGKEYTRVSNMNDAQLKASKKADIETVSKNLYMDKK